jgi:hypothetical protein
MKYLNLFICCLISCYGLAQKKYEKEIRVSKSEFPETALRMLDKHTAKAKRVRFFRETDSSKTSYEVKFKFEGKKYSVEFTKNGDLEDIEIDIHLRQLPAMLKKKINSFCIEKYRKYAIKKIQKQYFCSTPNDASAVFKTAISNTDSEFINYEVVVWRSVKNDSGMVELIFSKKGELLNERPFSQSSYDHILY